MRQKKTLSKSHQNIYHMTLQTFVWQVTYKTSYIMQYYYVERSSHKLGNLSCFALLCFVFIKLLGSSMLCILSYSLLLRLGHQDPVSIYYVSIYFVFLYLIFLSQQMLYFLLSTLVLTLYIDVVLSLPIWYGILITSNAIVIIHPFQNFSGGLVVDVRHGCVIKSQEVLL